MTETTVLGIRMIAREFVPPDEVWVVQDRRIVAKIVNIGALSVSHNRDVNGPQDAAHQMAEARRVK
jgi:hypothetical protein